MSRPIGPIRPSSTEDREEARAEAMGCVSGCFIYVFGVVLAVAAGAAVQAVWHTNWLTLAVGALVLAGGCWLGSRLWPRVEPCMERFVPDPYPEEDEDDQ
ncbi:MULTISPECIES: hypothetical protein [unclassified Streptomyces]|uniref:hypothetical protein n=1 Tax=unclassified Streptomyces TaxID=2593676 RepID=UPI00278C0DB4|nr:MULTISPECIES: hypothetical protein [unclassified Streptomyces]